MSDIIRTKLVLRAIVMTSLFLVLLTAEGLAEDERPTSQQRSQILKELSEMKSAPDTERLDLAIEQYRRKAESGNHTDECFLGFFYLLKSQNSNTAEERAEAGKSAVHYISRSAEAGNGDCEANLGTMYQNGYVVDRDPAKALKYYERALPKNVCGAEFGLAELYYFGMGVQKDVKKAVSYLMPSIARNCAKSAVLLGQIQYLGDLGKPDFESAAKYFRMALAKGNSDAARNLGVLYLWGKGVAKDPLEGRALVRLSIDNTHDKGTLENYRKVMKGLTQEELQKVEQRYQEILKTLPKREMINFPGTLHGTFSTSVDER